MANKDYSNLGDTIQSLVDDAVQNMNFAQLNRNITGSIQSVFDELGIDIDVRQVQASQSAGRRYTVKQPQLNKKPVKESLYAVNPPGSFTSLFARIAGGVLTGIFGFSLFMLIVVGAVIRGQSVAPVIISSAAILPLLVLSIFLLIYGIKSGNRLKRFRQYVSRIGGRRFCEINELADAVNKDTAFVVKDIEAMIDKHFFPHGHMDRLKTHLMLDEETYKQYLESAAADDRRQETLRSRREAGQDGFDASGINDPELVKAIEEGNRYMQQIRGANNLIPDPVISEKLDRMEVLIGKIFDVLKQNPDQLPKLRKFMKYYMPTTIKLVKVYQELDAQPVEGENIRKSKEEIAVTFDTINMAYEKLLDSFFEKSAMDVSSDISVLQTMLAQEGLTTQPFEK